MKLKRALHDPGELLQFYEEGLGSLGALCERTWHDRLEVVAEGRAAALWDSGGTLHEVELQFASANATSARDANREVFSGCPLTFRLAEALRLNPLPLERLVIEGNPLQRLPPDAVVAEKLWRVQFPDTTRFHLVEPFRADFHFTLFVLARCEIQAIDQNWSLRRMAISLPGGELDDHLAREIDFVSARGELAEEIPWPATDPAEWSELLRRAFEQELADELTGIRARQENGLRRDLYRIDEYFENYQRELNERTSRASSQSARIKTGDRLAAAKAEHARRRADQVSRHEIRVHPHLDALLLIAEPALKTRLRVMRAHQSEDLEVVFVPRSRRWFR
ncbi:MAG: hypothetical protein JWM99_1198 [Verrucomicrobiales bacterium]|nr:hypothetical protein [Verrucomicrobiales bacterium]